MRDVQVDVAVIGAGTAGLAARRAAMAAGAKTLIVEKGPWGTTCVRVGCMPSKLLLAAARSAREVGRAATFGVQVGPPTIDGRLVMARVRRMRDRFLHDIYAQVASIPDADKVEAQARFAGPTTLLVGDGLRVEAKGIVIATGSRPTVPKPLQSLGDRVLTNETVFELEDLPRSIAIVGAGPVGIEFGVAFSRLGVRTAVFDENDGVGGLKDPAVARAAVSALSPEVDFRLGTRIEASGTQDGIRIRWRGPSGQAEEVFERVLAATGRPPALTGLALETTGLVLREDGVPEHDPATLRCGTSTVFIAGDADHDRPVLHEASREGAVAGAGAACLATARGGPPPAALSITFTDPDMASIGTPLAGLGDGAVVGHCDSATGRGLIDERSGGIIRLYARREDGVLAGGEMVGPAVEHLAHLVAVLVQEKVTAERALALPFYHPCYEEDLKDCLRDLLDQLGGGAGARK